jgi:cytochrome b
MSSVRSAKTRILVWDAPTRVFHWLLAASFAGAYLTSESERFRDIHLLLGYTLVGLIGFRLVWGLIGTRYARFRSFAFGPGQVMAYLRSLVAFAPKHYVGHNPTGSWAIYLILGLGLLCGITGYASEADIGGELLKEAHESVAAGMLAVVVVHVCGVVVSSLLHRENLVRSMIDGYKSGLVAQGIRRAWWPVAIAIVAVVVGFWGGVIPAPLLSAPTVLSGVKHTDDDVRAHH